MEEMGLNNFFKNNTHLRAMKQNCQLLLESYKSLVTRKSSDLDMIQLLSSPELGIEH